MPYAVELLSRCGGPRNNCGGGISDEGMREVAARMAQIDAIMTVALVCCGVLVAAVLAFIAASWWRGEI